MLIILRKFLCIYILDSRVDSDNAIVSLAYFTNFISLFCIEFNMFSYNFTYFDQSNNYMSISEL